MKISAFFLCHVIFLLSCGAMAANSLPLDIMPDGSLKINGVEFSILHFGKGWKTLSFQNKDTVRAATGYPKKTATSWEADGVFYTNDGKFNIRQSVTEEGKGHYAVNITLQADGDVPTEEIDLYIKLPVEKFAGRSLSVDNQTITLPTEYTDAKPFFFNRKQFSKLSWKEQDFKLAVSGNGYLQINDERKYRKDHYSIRIKFPPSPNDKNHYDIAFKLQFIPYETRPISLRNTVNFGFKDEFAGDDKGGWTDQGPENDLHMLKPGQAVLGGVAFDIIDPASNNGKGCLVFGGDQIPQLPKTASVDVPSIKMKYLCVLHALAWAPATKQKIGSITVTYADSSKTTVPMTCMVDVGNWWNPASITNGEVVWLGQNKSSMVGLYMTTIPVSLKPMTRVDFESSGNSMWMIVGLSTANEEIPRQKNIPFYIVESENWKPVTIPRDVAKDSVLNFSFLLDAPAGKHGRVIVKDGKFVFENKSDTAQRFFGTNLSFSANFLDKPTCEKLAERLAAIGYNAVRFHHFDDQLVKKTATGSTELNPAAMDKLDYLAKCLKDKGIYLTLDLYISRIPVKGEFSELGNRPLSMNDIGTIKALLMISDTAMENFETYARNFFNHVNSYTGVAWKDEPALAFVSLINEGTIFSCWNHSPPVRKLYLEKFDKWLKDNKLNPSSNTDRARLMDKFLMEVYHHAYVRMSNFMKSIGVMTPLTDQNMVGSPQLAIMRNQYDYVDNHFYWDHPTFPGTPWAAPSRFTAKSAVANMAACPAVNFQSRIFGKPYAISEFNYCYPNAMRAEGGALIGAYSALQDWDALFRFEYAYSSSSVVNDGAATFFDTAVEPIQFMSEKLALLLFLRGDVRPSTLKIPVIVKTGCMDVTPVNKEYPAIVKTLGLLGQIGTIIDEKGKTAIPPDASKARIAAEAKGSSETIWNAIKGSVNLEKGKFDLGRSVVRSTTGEIEIDGKAGTMKVITPKSEAFVINAAGTLTGKQLSLVNRNDFAAISVSAMDTHDIMDSKRLLVLHLTNVMNNKSKFFDRSMTLLESSAGLPHLARRGQADITLKLAPGTAPRVYGVDLGGQRLGEVKGSFGNDGMLTFVADTFTFATPCFAYEIVR